MSYKGNQVVVIRQIWKENYIYTISYGLLLIATTFVYSIYNLVHSRI